MPTGWAEQRVSITVIEVSEENTHNSVKVYLYMARNVNRTLQLVIHSAMSTPQSYKKVLQLFRDQFDALGKKYTTAHNVARRQAQPGDDQLLDHVSHVHFKLGEAYRLLNQYPDGLPPDGVAILHRINQEVDLLLLSFHLRPL